MSTNRVLTIDGKALSDAASRITKIMTLMPDTGLGTGSSVPVLISCSKVGDKVPVVLMSSIMGMMCKTTAGFGKVFSPVPVTEFAISPDILQALGSSTTAVELTLTNDGFMSYRKAGLKGKVALCDPSSVPFVSRPNGITTVDFDLSLIKDLLNVTAFASADPRLASIGPITHIATGEGVIQVSTYDSMSAIVARKNDDRFRPGFELVIPNKTLLALITNSSKDVIKVGYDADIYYVRSASTEVMMPKSEYPVIDVATHIQNAIASSSSGFNVSGKDFYQAMERISSITKVDKDTLSVELKYDSETGNIMINSLSAKATATAGLRSQNRLSDSFSAMFDHSRLTAFTKQIAKLDAVDVYYSGQRMIFVTPNVTYAFPGS
jgi:hypothetical protein